MIVTDMSSSLAVHLQDVAALPRAQERAVSRFLKTFSVATSTHPLFIIHILPLFPNRVCILTFFLILHHM